MSAVPPAGSCPAQDSAEEQGGASGSYGVNVLSAGYGAQGQSQDATAGYGAAVAMHGYDAQAGQHGYHQPHQHQHQHQQQFHGHTGGSGGRGYGQQRVYHPPLPEHERCTVKVTGIPSYMTEADLREHFEDFGHIVALQLTEAPNKRGHEEQTTTEGDKKRTYLECLIQYHSAANARKCYTSTRSVRDNRMIQFRPAFFNLIPPAEVESPGEEVVARDAAIVAGTNVPPTKAPVSRKKPYSALHASTQGVYHQPGVTNKYRRGVDDAHHSIPAPTNASTSDAAGSALAEGYEEPTPSTSAEAGLGSPSVAPAPALTQEKHEARQKYDQLQQLRQQADEIAKKKETILQVRCSVVVRYFCIQTGREGVMGGLTVRFLSLPSMPDRPPMELSD